MRRFNPRAGRPARAIQAWQILVGMAGNRQTTTYEGLSKLMFGKKAAGVLSQTLGHIAFYCIDNRLPPLTALVVGKARGSPGDEFPTPDRTTIDEDRERVYRFDWYDVYPPSEKEFAKAASRPRTQF